jgi:excisionase family DNA binding protein
MSRKNKALKSKERDYMRKWHLMDYLGISLPQLNAMMKKGKIPYIKIGKIVLFNRAYVDKAIQGYQK